MKPWDSYDYLHQKYEVEGMSFGAIAKLHNTFSNTIRRAAKKHGIEPRTKSTAQKNFLNQHDHPMLGRERSQEEKHRISMGVQNYWEALDPEDERAIKDAMSERAKAKWEWMSEEEKKKCIEEMHKANREKSGCGSKNENMVRQLLVDAGYNAYERTNDFSPRRQFEIDIPVPSESVAIEWDGAAHFLPIYGEEDLQRVTSKDDRKNRALVDYGWTVIRVRDHSTAHSMAFCRRAVNKIIDILKNGKRGVVHHIDAE